MSEFKGFMDLMINSKPIEQREFNLEKDFEEMIKMQDGKPREFPRLVVSEKMHNWIKEHPKEFAQAWENMIKFICEEGGLI